MSPTTVEPGETVVIEGDGFGDGGRIELDGIAVPRDAIRMWRDDRLSFVMQPGFDSGLLRIRTDTGASEPVFLNSTRDLPRILAAPNQQSPTIEPQRAAIGERVEIRGVRFGPRHGRTGLRFLTGGERHELSAGDPMVVAWGGDQAAFLVPPSLPAGEAEVALLDGTPLGVVQIAAPAATVTEAGRARFALLLRVTVGGSNPNTLIVMPRLPRERLQPSVQLLRELGSLRDDSSAAMWIYAGAPESGTGEATVARTVLVERVAAVWQLESTGSPDLLLDQSFRRAFRDFLGPASGLAYDAEAIRALRTRTVDVRLSPDGIARAVHDATIAALSPDRNGTADVVAAVGGEGASAEAYAALAVTLARLSGVPARRIGGVVISDGGRAYPHYWMEFFLPRIGWVPADPAVGDGLLDDDFSRLLAFHADDPAARGFGRIDARRVALAVGGSESEPWYPLGGIIQSDRVPALGAARVEVPDRDSLDSLAVRWDSPALIAEL